MMEEEMRLLQMLVDTATAERLLKDGKAEVVLRQLNMRYESFVKCRILENKDRELGQQICNAALANKPSFLGGIAGMVPYLNIGISAANLAVNIIGLIELEKRTDEICREIGEIGKRIDSIAKRFNDQTIEQKGIADKIFNSLVDRIRNKESIDIKEIDDYVIKTCQLMNKLICQAREGQDDQGLLIDMIYSLLPVYTNALCMDLEYNMHRRGCKPTNYGAYMEIFSMLADDDFRDDVQDHYILRRNKSYREASDLMERQLLAVSDSRLQSDDLLALMEVFNTEESFLQFCEQLDSVVHDEVMREVPNIARECDIPEERCRMALAV